MDQEHHGCQGPRGDVEQIVHSFMADQTSKRANTYLLSKAEHEDVLEDLPLGVRLGTTCDYRQAPGAK